MLTAVWQGADLASSRRCQKLEDNWYFPPDSIVREFFAKSSTRTQCRWKGTAHYYSLVVAGAVNVDAAWYYPETRPRAGHIQEWIAFWRGVEIREDRSTSNLTNHVLSK